MDDHESKTKRLYVIHYQIIKIENALITKIPIEDIIADAKIVIKNFIESTSFAKYLYCSEISNMLEEILVAKLKDAK